MDKPVVSEAERLMREFYVSSSYDPKARPADNVKAAIAFAMTAASQPITEDAVQRVANEGAEYRKELRSVLADCSEFLAGDVFAASGYPEAMQLADRCEAMLAQVVAEDRDRAAIQAMPTDEGLIKASERLLVATDNHARDIAEPAFLDERTALREALSRHKAPLSVAVERAEPSWRSADTYELGQVIFNHLHGFLNAVGINGTDCKLTISVPTDDDRKKLTKRLQSDMGDRGPPRSAGRHGNSAGTWQGIAYEFAALTALQVTEGDKVERPDVPRWECACSNPPYEGDEVLRNDGAIACPNCKRPLSGDPALRSQYSKVSKP